MDFKKGDVVQLKSGGPKMTIDNIGKYNYSPENQALCVWFEKSDKKNSTFNLESIKKVED